MIYVSVRIVGSGWVACSMNFFSGSGRGWGATASIILPRL